MYSNIPGVQILLSLLKQHNIKHLVISPGTRNTALVHSVECDDFFTCYSVVDERSAGFFALGLSEELDVPVCVTCTAATATCNYMPAIKEAYERNIQLIALTADQDTYSKFHMGDQNIDQNNMFDGYVRYAIDVPKINNQDDYWFFNRCVNEAFLELNHNTKGPIQINFRMNYDLDEISYFPESEIKPTRAIKRYKDNIDYEKLAETLNNKKIIVFCGSEFRNNCKTKEEILKFQKKTNCVILADYYSNIIDDNIINPSVLGDIYRNKDYMKLKPDIIIMNGSVIYAPLKGNKNLFSIDIETWEISEDGRINDGFRNVKKVFECDTYDFFKNINEYIKNNENKEIRNEWEKVISKVEFKNLGYTHMSVIQKFISKIPNNSMIHMSVLDAIRISNYFKMPNNVKCFANIGADGIDGALSTFLGQASQIEELSFLLIGDLSLMYDMNALYDKIPNNIRILVINNYAGSEFHKNFGLKRIPTLNKHIAAGHETTMEDVISINDFKYMNAKKQEELEEKLKVFLEKSDKPIVLEVFTNADNDANTLKRFWFDNQMFFSSNKQNIKRKIGKIIGPEFKMKIKKIIGRG